MKKLLSFLQQKPWHVLFIALFPIVFLFAENMEYVSFKDTLAPMALSLVLGFILLIISKLIFKTWIKAGAITSLILFLFFSFGAYYEHCQTWSIPFFIKPIQLDHNFFKWTSLCLLVLTSWGLIKAKGKLFKMNALLNFIGFILLGMSIFNIVQFKREQEMSNSEFMELQESDTSSGIQKLRPTIYYLIMDAYTSNDVLRDYFDYDNSAFTDMLKSKGFYVADKSISNYGQTILSVPSALNMMYLDSIIEDLGPQNEDRWPMAKVLNNNIVLQKLKEQNYRSISFDASIMELVYLKSTDDFHETPGTQLNLFQNELLNTTALRAFNRRKKLVTTDPFDFHRKKILEAFRMMGRIAEKVEPFYVHGHVLSPHQPFVFDRNGKSVTPPWGGYSIWAPLRPDSDNSVYKKGYVEQLQYINKKLEELIDKIQSNKDRPAIIIIQGDHGTCSELRNHHGFDNNDFRERFSIMNAYYFPDQEYSDLYKGISPVNSFKVVMNKYFDGNYELEPDRAYFSDWDHPFELTDVTGIIKQQRAKK